MACVVTAGRVPVSDHVPRAIPFACSPWNWRRQQMLRAYAKVQRLREARSFAPTLLLAICLAIGSFAFPGRCDAYDWATDVRIDGDRPLSITCTDTYLNASGDIEMSFRVDYESLGHPVLYVERWHGGSRDWTRTLDNIYTFTDSASIEAGVEYQYRVKLHSDEDRPPMSLGPDPNANCPSAPWHRECGHPQGYVRVYLDEPASGQPWIMQRVVAVKVPVTANQSVDSRIDPREADPCPPINFQFGATTYRGGLFVGNTFDVAPNVTEAGQRDHSRVGRSLLKFDMSIALPAYGTWSQIFGGRLFAYYNRALREEDLPMSIGCRVLSNNWDPSTVVWSTQGQLSSTGDARAITISQSTAGSWLCFPANGDPVWAQDLQTAWSVDKILSFRLASMDENRIAWAYLAKKEFGDHTKGAYLLFARTCPPPCN